MKTEVIPFKSFCNGTWNQKPQSTAVHDLKMVFVGAGTVLALITPQFAHAASADTFTNLHTSVMNMFDAGVVLVFIFAGACWALGHRGKAIELTIGASAGYLLARHATDIRDFLKGI